MKSLKKRMRFAIYILLVAVLVGCNNKEKTEQAIAPFKVEIELKNDTIRMLKVEPAKLRSEIATLKTEKMELEKTLKRYKEITHEYAMHALGLRE